MKLPFDLGAKLFFRLIVPGAFLSLCLLPMLFTVLDLLHFESQHEIGLAVAIMGFGWSISLADMPIYMLLEGRRFWPSWLLTWCRALEARRLTRILQHVQSPDVRIYREASVRLREFPLDQDGRPTATFPTRLGNLITAIETYPDTRYGMDGIFFWPRIWIHLDKDTRESLDNLQAVADSAVYSSFALLLCAFVWLFAAVARFVGVHPLGVLGLKPAGYVPMAATSATSAGAALLLAGLIYFVALFANAQYGEYFKAVFDVHVTRSNHFAHDIMDIESIVERVETLTGDWTLQELPSRDKFTIAWRYLHNFRIKCPYCNKAIPVPTYGAHVLNNHPDVR